MLSVLADYSPSDDITDLLERYTVTYRPEYFLKLRKKYALSCSGGSSSQCRASLCLRSVKAATLGGNYCFGRRGRYCTFSVSTHMHCCIG